MAISGAQKQKEYRARQKQKRLDGDPAAIEQWERKKVFDRGAYQRADKSKLNEDARARYARRMTSDPAYKQLKRDEAKLYVERHPEKVKERKRCYRESNRDMIAAYNAQWDRANRDKRYALNAKRQYLLKQGQVEPINRELIWDRDQGCCGICGLTAELTNWHLDHVIPLSKGGSHTYDNVQVSHPVCNIRKGNSLVAHP